MGDDRVYVGVLHLRLRVPGARTRKDRRQVVSSVRDRLKSRFGVTVNEVGTGADPAFQSIVITTGGNDAHELRSVLDRCVGAVHAHPVAEAVQVDVDVFPWEPAEDAWAQRMMDELSEPDDG